MPIWKTEEKERWELNASEATALELIAGLDAQLQVHDESLKERMQEIGGGCYRDYRLAMSRIAKVIGMLYETCPDKTIRHMQMLAKCGEVVVRPRPITPDYVQIVENGVLYEMVNNVVKNECVGCFARGSEAKGCKIRKMLSKVATVRKIERDGTCPFQQVVQDNPYGKYTSDHEEAIK